MKVDESISEAVSRIYTACLYPDVEADLLGKQEAMKQGKFGAGILTDTVFKPSSLLTHRAEIFALLRRMPAAFHRGSGDGWSFLNLCNDAAGNLWTGEHRQMEKLVSLAMALGVGQFIFPRDLWEALPGGMPYVGFDLPPEA